MRPRGLCVFVLYPERDERVAEVSVRVLEEVVFPAAEEDIRARAVRRGEVARRSVEGAVRLLDGIEVAEDGREEPSRSPDGVRLVGRLAQLVAHVRRRGGYDVAEDV